MVVIGLQGLDQKIKIMRERRKLRERGLRIDDDVEEEENEMESGRHSKKGERRRKESMGKLRKDINRRKVVEMGRRGRDTQR